MTALGPIAAAFAAAVLVAIPARAASPLACDDKRVVDGLRAHLQNVGANAEPPRKFIALTETREVQLGAPPRSANQYATAATYIAVSRYCEGNAAFGSGDPLRVYWRLDLMKDGDSQSTHTDLCHKFWDQFGDGCKAFRPER